MYVAENLFAQKLRRTVSQPALTLTSSTGKLSSAQLSSNRRGAKAAVVNGKQRPTLSTSSSAPAPAPSHAQNASRILHRSKSTSLVVPTSTSSSSGGGSGSSSSKARNPFAKQEQNGLKRSSSADTSDSARLHLSPGRRGQKRPRLTAGGLRALQEEENEDSQDFESLYNGDHSRERELSPTPSIASVRSFQTAVSANTAVTVNGHGGGKKPISRSMSMPPGQIHVDARSVRGASRQPTEREGSVAPTETGEGKADLEANSMATRNKGVSDPCTSVPNAAH